MTKVISAPPNACKVARRLILIGVVLIFTACGGSGGENAYLTGSATFTLSGNIAPPPNAAVDWDVKDANTTSADKSNNSLSSPQSLSNPVGLAGHDARTPGNPFGFK